VDFLRVVAQLVRLNDFLFVSCSSLQIIKSFARRVQNDLCRVIEKDACCSVWKQVPKPIFLGIVYPFLNPYLRTQTWKILLHKRLWCRSLGAWRWRFQSFVQICHRTWLLNPIWNSCGHWSKKLCSLSHSSIKSCSDVSFRLLLTHYVSDWSLLIRRSCEILS